MQSNSKKRQRSTNHRHFSATAAAATASTLHLSSTSALIDSLSDKTVIETSRKLLRTSSFSSASSTTAKIITFNDPSTADVILHLYVDPAAPSADDSVSLLDNNKNQSDDVQIYLHSHILTRAKYFSALLSDRWQNNNRDNNDNQIASKLMSLRLGVPPIQNSIDNHLTVLELLYTEDFPAVITSVSIALDILPVALQLLFEGCVKNCVKFLEAVPWSEEDENRLINLIPLLSNEESELLLARVRVRVSTEKKYDNSCEEMLHGLILSAIHNHPNTAFVKAFVAKLLRDFSSRDSAKIVLEKAFEGSLKVVKESLEEYASPDFRGGGDYNETEAMQRLNLHTALTNGKHLLWLVERMIELKVADNAVKEWSEQGGFTGDLQRAFRDDAWRNIVPGLPAVVLRCTAKLANAVANGTILAARQVRMKLVKDWLPVLIVCKDNVSPLLPSHKSLYLELEETFLRIISTLPMSDAQELLKQCLSFSTRNVEDCPHLVSAFNTWFRRAMRPSLGNLF